MPRWVWLVTLVTVAACDPMEPETDAGTEPPVRVITEGPRHHFYGYIGHVGNTPFSGDDRWLVALRTTFQDRLPAGDEPAELVLLDADDDFVEEAFEQTRAWNPQQGTMLYWDPEAPTERLFFNDRDPDTGEVFTVLYDVVARRRLREYRIEGTPVANGGVSQVGGTFAAINYARLARLRPVTGYPGSRDWTEGVAAPEDDGLFVVDVETGAATLIASYARLRDAIVDRHPAAAEAPLFINHTLWNRDGDRIYFFVRGNFESLTDRVNVPMTIRPDGSELTEQTVFIGGHPEWAEGATMLGAREGELVLYDTESQTIVETVGTPEAFPDPEGDTALSRDGTWIVNGWAHPRGNRYTLFERATGAWIHTEAFDRGEFVFGDTRIDGAPTWSRAGDRVVVPALAPDGTRQMFLIPVPCPEPCGWR